MKYGCLDFQVLWGDIGAAIHTHDMLYHVTQRHNFLPEVRNTRVYA